MMLPCSVACMEDDESADTFEPIAVVVERIERKLREKLRKNAWFSDCSRLYPDTKGCHPSIGVCLPCRHARHRGGMAAGEEKAREPIPNGPREFAPRAGVHAFAAGTVIVVALVTLATPQVREKDVG